MRRGVSLLPKCSIYIFFSALLLVGCGHSLKVQTDYLTHKDLASYFVNTPDPRQNIAVVGQRLIIGWIVPKSYLSYNDLHLEVTIRFRNKEEVVEIFYLPKTRGTYVFALLGADYFQKRGILTYKVNLIGNGCILEEWRHQIWFDYINIKAEEPSASSLEEQPSALQEEEYPIDWNDPDF